MRTPRHRHLATADRASSIRFLSQIGAVVAVATVLVVFLSSTASAATFTVNTTSDTDDGACDSAHCSLREAITLANTSPGSDLIAFNIAGANPHTIQPSSPLPEITEPVTIDASTQPGYSGIPVIELDGTNAGLNTTGLHITSGDSVVRGLVINSFGGTAIHIETGDGNRLEANFINSNVGGTDFADGVMFMFDPGVLIEDSSGNLIGGPDTAPQNLLAGRPALVIRGASSEDNTVQGNYIGTDVTGSRVLDADESHSLAGGILIDAAPGNLIGGDVEDAGNLIGSGVILGRVTNLTSIRIQGVTAEANVVQGNLIGPEATGSADLLFSGGAGVLIDNAPGTLIGSTTVLARNVLSGSNPGVRIDGQDAVGTVIQGNFFGTKKSGLEPVPEPTDNGVGVHIQDAPGTVISAGNVLSAMAGGITISGEGSIGTVIQGNMIGTDKTGTVGLGNTIGIWIIQDASDVTIGGPGEGQRNVISDNDFGIESSASNVGLENNYIGTDITGKVPIGNGARGALLRGENNIVVDNVISANAGVGLALGGGACNTEANVVQGNFFGTNPSGTEIVGTQGIGIRLQDIQNVVVGGTTAATRNVVSGNGTGIEVTSCAHNPIRPGQVPSEDVRIVGNYIGTDASGTTVLGNTGPGISMGGTFGSGTVVGGTEAGSGNVISGNGIGLLLRDVGSGGAVGVPVQGNRIGADVTGMLGLGNRDFGIRGIFSRDNVIGGATRGAANVLAANRLGGILFQGGQGNIIHGNLVGLAIDRTTPLPNGTLDFTSVGGVSTLEPGTIIGGSNPGEGNVVSGNHGFGIFVAGDGATVQGNIVGLDANGSIARANTGDGIKVAGENNIIGGPGLGEGNVIAANGGSGITVAGTPGSTFILGNLIGTNASGDHGLGNGGDGILDQGANTRIGSSSSGEGNVIVSNRGDGIRIRLAVPRTIVAGNMVGLLADGTPMGNAGNGISLVDRANGNRIGGSEAEANVIAYNTGAGIAMFGHPDPFDNFVSANSIHSNGQLGIDLSFLLQKVDGPTLNDDLDDDVGPNGFQNFPVLQSVSSDGVSTRLVGSLSSSPDGAYRVEFFANDTVGCDPSGFGEGQRFLGSADVVTGSDGVGGFDVTLPVGVSAGGSVTATATDATGNTSEFSRCAGVDPPPVGADVGVVKSASAEPVAEGERFTYLVEVSNVGPVAAFDVRLVDTLPFGLGLVSVTPGQGSCESSSVEVVCELGALEVGESTTVEMLVEAGQAGEVINRAVVSAAQDDPELSNNEATVTTTVIDLAASLSVSKVAEPSVVAEPGGVVTFHVSVVNTSVADTVELVGLSDSVFGSLDGRGDCATGAVLAPGEQYECSFSETVSGNAGTVHTDQVVVSGLDDDGGEVSASASALVTVTDAPPTLDVLKIAIPETVPETGGVVTYQLTIVNTSGTTDPVTITSLTDEIWTDLDGDGEVDGGETTVIDPTDPSAVESTDCSLPQVVAGDGGSYFCSFTTQVAGNPWADPTDTVTAVGTDDENSTVHGSASAVVDISQKFQRSIDLQDEYLDFSLTASRDQLDVTLFVVNASDQPADVLIIDVDLNIQYREQQRGAKWVTTNSVCLADPQLPVTLINDITLGFSCQLTGPIPAGAELRVTATVLIDGRDKSFIVTRAKPS